MNRSKNFLSIVANLIAFLQNFKIEDIETLNWWTTGLIPNETLMSGEKQKEIYIYYQAVMGRCSLDMKQALIKDILFEIFKQTKRGAKQAPTD